MRLFSIILILCLLKSLAFANDGFILHSLDEAQQLSLTTDKPILLIFGADYCNYCHKLKQDILNTNIDSHEYIICYIDLDKNIQYRESYQISILPDSRIFDHKKEITRLQGYQKETYKKWLKNARRR